MRFGKALDCSLALGLLTKCVVISMSCQAAADLWHDTQDVGEELDPSLEPVLAKAFVKRGKATLIKLGDKEIDFNPDFRLYITTKLGRHAVCIVPFTGRNIPLPQ